MNDFNQAVFGYTFPPGYIAMLKMLLWCRKAQEMLDEETSWVDRVEPHITA